MAFVYQQKVKFRHCDPAGIVFYPRYFEMINDTVEAFFEKVARFPFAAMHESSAVPTAAIEAQFQAPTRLGDRLQINLTATGPGRSSLGLAFDARCGVEQRFTARSTVVFVDDSGRPAPWPDKVRARLEQHIEEIADVE